MYWYISIFKLQKLDPFYLNFRAEFNGFIARAQNNRNRLQKCQNHDRAEKRTPYVFRGLNVRGDVKNIQ